MDADLRDGDPPLAERLHQEASRARTVPENESRIRKEKEGSLLPLFNLLVAILRSGLDLLRPTQALHKGLLQAWPNKLHYHHR